MLPIITIADTQSIVTGDNANAGFVPGKPNFFMTREVNTVYCSIVNLPVTLSHVFLFFIKL